jgi:hypothetical protein
MTYARPAEYQREFMEIEKKLPQEMWRLYEYMNYRNTQNVKEFILKNSAE